MGIENFLIFLLLSVVSVPIILAIGCLVLIMTCPWSKNLRKGYVDLLLKIFQVSCMSTQQPVCLYPTNYIIRSSMAQEELKQLSKKSKKRRKMDMLMVVSQNLSKKILLQDMPSLNLQQYLKKISFSILMAIQLPSCRLQSPRIDLSTACREMLYSKTASTLYMLVWKQSSKMRLLRDLWLKN